MWESKQFLCEMVNDIFILDDNLKKQLDSIKHEYDDKSEFSKIFLDITNKCNIRCKHCFTNARAESCLEELTTNQIKRFIDELVILGIDRLALGGGEPLVREDIYEIVEYAANKGVRIHISSNSILLTEKNVARLKKIGLDSIQISIDSMYPEIHDELRQTKGLFNHCMEAIKIVQKYNISLIISTTITKLNIDELEGILEMSKSLGVKMHRFIRFVPVGRGEVFKDSLYVEPERLIPAMLKLYKKFNNSYFGDKNTVFGIPVNKANETELKEFDNPIGCEAGKLCVDVLPNGNVVPCNYLGTDEIWVCGNIKNESLIDILNNSPVIKKFKELNGLDIKGCSTCKLQKKCGKGCRAVAYNYYGDVLNKDPYCTRKERDVEYETCSK